jgi:hypothetical protein
MKHTHQSRWRLPVLGIALSLSLVAAGCSSGDDGGAAKAPAKDTATSSKVIGTAAALAAPDCDKSYRGGHVAAPMGVYGPKCAEPWPAGGDNGGATTTGVTATEIKVLIRVGPTATPAANATTLDVYTKMGEAYEHAFRMWGRHIKFEIFQASGLDEVAERADAKRAAELKPFAVLVLPDAGRVFETEVARNKIITVGFNDYPDDAMTQAPYRWGAHEDIWAVLAFGAEFLGKELLGHPAQWAGDDLKTKDRKVGLVIRDSLPKKIFVDELAAYDKAKVAEEITYKIVNASGGIIGDPVQSQEQAPTIIAKLKSSGITTVMAYTDVEMTTALFKEATKQGYFPEWSLTGLWYSTVPYFFDRYDSQQIVHAFGVNALNGPPSKSPPNPIYAWYWGSEDPTTVIPRGQASTLFRPLFGGVHGAGPKLTPAAFEKGNFATFTHEQCNCHVPLQGYGPGLYKWTDYSLTDDAGIWFFDPNEMNSFGTKGVPRYINDAHRYLLGSLPKGEPKLFDNTNAPFAYDTDPPADKVPDYPCNDCPSSKKTG